MAEKESHMNIEADIKQFITTELLAKDSSLGESDTLVSSGRVDSMGLLQILSFIQQRFGVDLMAVGSPHDFDTVAALAAAVRRNKGGD
jgi:acyl carrier protein